MINMSWNEGTKSWDVVFPDCSTRSFDGRFTETQAWAKATRYWNGTDSYFDGIYSE